MGRLYAVVVGIDQYPPSVPGLRGCVADARAVQQMLLARNPDAEIRLLTDAEATRQTFVDTVRRHLSQAHAGDAALLWYSGHGSHQATSRADVLGPAGQDQTLVLYDSRTPGSSDLLDVELGDLITGVASEGAHVVAVLDCCHSGSGTRDPLDPAAATVRQAPPDPRGPQRPQRLSRPLEPSASLANAGDAGGGAAASTAAASSAASPGLAASGPDRLPIVGASVGAADGEMVARPAGWSLGVGRHVLVAACRSDQTAKEVVTPTGERRGAMSWALQQVLEAAGLPPTYADLIALADTRVRAVAMEQFPQLEVTNDEDARLPFLGGALPAAPAHYRTVFEGGGWTVAAGTWQGLASGGATPARLRLHPPGADVSRPDTASARAEVASADSARSRLNLIEGSLSSQETYWAVVERLSVPQLRVSAGSGPAGAAVQASPWLALSEPDTAQASVTGDGPFEARDHRRQPGNLPDLWPADSPAQATALLEKIARWHHLVGLDNPQTRIGPDEVTLDVQVRSADGSLRQAAETDLDLLYQDDQPQEISLTVRNTSDRTLFVTAYDLSADYEIRSDQLTPGNVVRLAPHETWPAADGASFQVVVPDKAVLLGATSSTSVLKVVTSTVEFDPLALTQPGATAGPSPAGEQPGPSGQSSEVGGGGEAGEGDVVRALQLTSRTHADWTTRTVRITARRLPPAHRVGERPVIVADGVTVGAHPAFRADLRLSSLRTTSRDALQPLLPPALQEQPDLSGPFSLDTHRGDEALDVLELTGVVGADEVTPESPLRIDTGAAPDEHILVIGFQDGVYLPVGYATPQGQLRIEQIPHEVSTRSLGSSVRLLLRKFARRLTGAPTDTVRLAIATCPTDAPDSVHYEADPTRVADSVRTAARVAVLVHGILGDTRELVRGSLIGDAAGPGLASQYDLLLAVDYENINTTIDQTATQLLRQLKEAGVTPDRPIDIIAHSMGGLVARWLIEVAGGAPLVSRLITFGTPNNGSPWPRAQDAAFTLLAFALNKIAPFAWPAAVVTGLLSAIERIDSALDDMAPNSARLQTLNSAPDPGVRYEVVVGNTALIDGYTTTGLARVAAALARRAAWLVSMGQDNDLAVVVDSARNLPPGRSPTPEVKLIACDHVSYFSCTAGLTALRAVATSARSAAALAESHQVAGPQAP